MNSPPAQLLEDKKCNAQKVPKVKVMNALDHFLEDKTPPPKTKQQWGGQRWYTFAVDRPISRRNSRSLAPKQLR